MLVCANLYLCYQKTGPGSLLSLNSTLVNGDVALQANKLKHLSPEANGWCDEGCFVCINERSIPNKVNLVGLEPLSLLEDLPEYEQDRGNANHGVVGEERLEGEVSWLKCRVSIDKNDTDLKDESDPGAVGLEVTAVWESLAIEALDLARLVESKIGTAHDDEVDDTTSSDDVGEPCQDLGRVVRKLQK